MSARSERSVTGKANSEIESEFKHLADRWRRDTAIESSSKIVLHPAYQRIIGMGKAVLPLILADLEVNAAHWSWALRAITGESPIDEQRLVILRRCERLGFAGVDSTSI